MAARKGKLNNSADGQIQAFKRAEEAPVYEWPGSTFDLPSDEADSAEVLAEFFDIQTHRSRDHWAGRMHQNLLAELCLLNHQIRMATKALALEGSVVTSAKGGQVRSPNLDALSMMVSIRQGLQRNLGITETQRNSDGEAAATIGAKKIIGRAKQNTLDELLA